MTRRTSKLTYALAALVAALVLLITSISGGGAFNASAATSYSNVLDDLRKDTAFNVEEYPAIKGDNSLQVIQIAESTDGDLLVYVYQPGATAFGYKAKSINIARESDNSVNLNFGNYFLTYLNSTGVFYKYRVDGLKVNSDNVRYYNISNILRPWDRYLDMNTGNDNTVSEVPFKVAQYWTVTGTGENVSYYMTTSEVVEVTEKYVGYVLYSDGTLIKWANISAGWTNAHFVAFSTDKPIDKLLSVKLSFTEVPVTSKYCCNILHTNGSNRYENRFDIVYGEPIEHKDHNIVYTDKGGNVGGGNYVKADPYAWYRIRTKDEFISDENNKDYILTKGTTANIETTSWVLSFYETPFSRVVDDITLDADESYSRINDVMILQLEFETDGQTYKLGVVDNKQTGGNKPGNEPTEKPGTVVPWWVWLLVALGAVVIVLILICIFVPGAAPVIGRGLLQFGKALLWVIFLPFRLLAALFRSIGNAIARRKATAAAKSTQRKNKSKSTANKSRSKSTNRKKAGKKKK